MLHGFSGFSPRVVGSIGLGTVISQAQGVVKKGWLESWQLGSNGRVLTFPADLIFFYKPQLLKVFPNKLRNTKR